MIQMRVGQWETNSSSCHSFLMPKEGCTTKLPTSITLFSGSSVTSSESENRIRYFYKLADHYDYGDAFIEYLKSKGIVIEDEGENVPSFNRMLNRFRMSEEQLDAFCFGTNIIDCDTEEYEEKRSDYENYIHVYIER